MTWRIARRALDFPTFKSLGIIESTTCCRLMRFLFCSKLANDICSMCGSIVRFFSLFDMVRYATIASSPVIAHPVIAHPVIAYPVITIISYSIRLHRPAVDIFFFRIYGLLV